MRRFALLILWVVLFSLIGCGKQPIVGTWEGTIGASIVTLTFKGDKSMSQKLVMTAPTGEVTINVTGRYELKDKSLTFTDLKIGEMKGVPKEMEALARKQAEPELTKPVDGTVEFKGEELILTIKGNPATFRRK